MNDVYYHPYDADKVISDSTAALLTIVKTWPIVPSVVLVPTILPTKNKGIYTQDQNMTQSVARATREVGKNFGVAVADANRLYTILRDGRDDTVRSANKETGFEGYNTSAWTGNKDQFSLSAGVLTPLNTSSKFVTRARPFYNGMLKVDIKPINPSDTAWINYRMYGWKYLTLFVVPGAGTGEIGIYKEDGTRFVYAQNLNIPFNSYSNIMLEANGTKHTVYLNGVPIIDATIYANLFDGNLSFGSNDSSVVYGNLEITYESTAETESPYSEIELLGAYNNANSGNGINHPSGLGHTMFYLPAFNGLLRELSNVKSSYSKNYIYSKSGITPGSTVDLFTFAFTSGDFKSLFVEVSANGTMQGVGTRIVTTTLHLFWDSTTASWQQLSNYARGSETDALVISTVGGASPKISCVTCGTDPNSDLKVSMRVLGDSYTVAAL